MVLSRELVKRLHSSTEPLPKRLKLAENAFHSMDIPVIRKEDVILQWLCELNSTEQNVWGTLKRCLQMEHFNVKTEIKKKVINTIVCELKKKIEDVNSDVLECCNLLLLNTGIQQYFIDTPKDLGVFVKAILQYIHCFLKESLGIKNPINNGIPINLIYQAETSVLCIYNMGVSIIESVTHIYKHSTKKQHNLKIIFVKDILYPLCKIIDHNCVGSTNRLGAAAHKCVQQVFFGRIKPEQYKTYNTDSDSDIFSGIRSVLAQCVEVEDLQSNLLTLVFVFRAAIGFYKSDSAALDSVFRELIEIAGQYKKEILHSFFQHLKDITFDFDNTINNITLAQYLEENVNIIMSNEHLASIDYELLTAIAHFNPIMIESRIQEILKKIYHEEKLVEHTTLIIELLECSIQLRKEENFVSQLLIALKEALLLNKKCNAKALIFFPREFQEKFTKSVGKITNNQVVTILRTLTNYLNQECMEYLNAHNSCKNVAMIRATVELFIALFNGVRIFEHTGTLSSHKVFANVFNDFSKVLSQLVDRVLQLNYNTKLISLLLSLIFKWTEVQSTLLYYVPNAVTQAITFPILDDHWKQLTEKITNFGDEDNKINMNKLILHQMKDKVHIHSPIKLKNLIGGLEYTWEHILKNESEILSFVNNKDLSKLADLLMTKIIVDNSDFDYWLQQLTTENLQGNERFIATLLSSILVQIGTLLSGGVTGVLTTHIDAKEIMKSMVHKNEKLSDTLNVMKGIIDNGQWVCVKSKVPKKMVPYLKILLTLPISVFNTDIKTLLFLVTYAITEECVKDKDVIDLCNKIFSDLLEKSGMDILQIIEFGVLIEKSQQNKYILKALELSLKNVSSYEILKSWIDCYKRDKDRISTLLECIENIKLKLSTNQKAVFIRAERKIIKLMLKTMDEEVKGPSNVRNLTLLLKVAINHEKISEDLKKIVHATLNSIFAPDNHLRVDDENQLVQEGLQLALVVLRNSKEFQLTDVTIKQLWYSMLKCADKALLLHLVCASGPRAFYEMMKLLHNQVITDLSEGNEKSFENSCLIWNAVMKSDMSPKRNKLRLTAIDNLLHTIQVSRIPQTFWPVLLRLLNTIINSRHLQISDSTADIIIFLTVRSLEEDTILICETSLMICTTLVKTRTNLITNRLPALLLLYRRIINVIVSVSKNINDKYDEHRCRCLALDLEKLTSLLLKQKKELTRLSPYVISDMLKPLSESVIPSFIKEPMENCVCQHISICDQHAVALLFRALPVSIQELFKAYLERYNKFYKFSGKI